MLLVFPYVWQWGKSEAGLLKAVAVISGDALWQAVGVAIPALETHETQPRSLCPQLPTVPYEICPAVQSGLLESSR